MKKASVYKLPSRFIVCPVSTTTSGIGINSEPYIVLPASASAVELGEAINQALNSSYKRVAHPLSWKGLTAPRLVAAGVKSEAAFQKQALLVSVTNEGNKVTLTPHWNGGATGPNKGFSPIDECTVRMDARAPQILGETTFQVFEHCT